MPYGIIRSLFDGLESHILWDHHAKSHFKMLAAVKTLLLASNFAGQNYIRTNCFQLDFILAKTNQDISKATDRFQKCRILLMQVHSMVIKQAFTKRKLKNIQYVHTSHKIFWMLSVPPKFWWHRRYCALNHQQSGFISRCSECLPYIISSPMDIMMIKLLGICQYIQSLGNNRIFLSESNFVWISVADSQSNLWLIMMLDSESLYCTCQDVPQKEDLWNIFFNESFYLEWKVEVGWSWNVSLHTLLRRHICRCPRWSLTWML